MKISTIAKALVNDEFVFYYQPIVSLFSGKICGAESLIRWKQPDGTIIPPSEFIPLAEEKGFITEITHHMLPKVVLGLETLNQIDDSLFVSFNVSANDFSDKEFLDTLQNTVSGRLRKKENLFIEITETSFLPSDPHIQKNLHEIDEQGLSIVLNDFTSGYTTFSTLTQLPIKALKIAMEVTQRAPTSRMDFRLFRHLVSMANQLRLSIIAEGVENYETHSLMAAVGCTHTQGFYYARPMPLDNFIELLNKTPDWLEYPFGLEYLAQFDHIDFRRDVIRASLMIYRNQEKELRERALARLPELNHEKCRFGVWHKNIESLNKGNKSYLQLGIEHKEFHDIANLLLEKSLAHANWTEIEKIIVNFSNKSKIMMNLIQDLEIKKLKDYFAST